MSKHTPEPWGYEAPQSGFEDHSFGFNQGDMAGFVYQSETGEILLEGNYDDCRSPQDVARREADLLRAAMAVDACAGVPTERLKRDMVKELVTTLETLVNATGRTGWHNASPTVSERKTRAEMLVSARAVLANFKKEG